MYVLIQLINKFMSIKFVDAVNGLGFDAVFEEFYPKNNFALCIPFLYFTSI